MVHGYRRSFGTCWNPSVYDHLLQLCTILKRQTINECRGLHNIAWQAFLWNPMYEIHEVSQSRALLSEQDFKIEMKKVGLTSAE